tara:strand:- start:1586 stop:1894 length:309 start_codon:yes stop_codon:yes gene_type:complete
MENNQNKQNKQSQQWSSNTDGWDGLSEVEVQNNPPEPSELDKNFSRTFKTEDGKKVLEYLKTCTIDQPTWTPGVDASHGYLREGQNSIIREMLNRIRRCDNG